MYPMTPTETELMSKKIEEDAPKITEMLKEQIELHNAKIPQIRQGVDYYFNKGEITKRKIEVFDENGNKTEDKDATNNKVPSGWHKLLVDQKVSYLVGDPITLSSKSEKDITPIQDVLGEEFEDVLPELVKNASNKGKEWLHPYIDENGNFNYMIIPNEEFIPLYADNRKKDVVGGIRFYAIDDELTKIELWDTEQVTFYEMIKDDIYIDVTVEVNPQSHFYYKNKGYGWSTDDKKIAPFIEFKNNEEGVSDLTFYKALIDVYDLLVSDVSNTLEDIQSFIYVLKGYEGTNAAEFMMNLKRYKMVSVSDGEGAGVDTLRAEVPVDAVKTHIDRIVQDIYTFGNGVNSSPDKFGNAPSGVAIKNLYSLLDMKSSIMERKFSKALEKFMWFVCEYLSISNQGDFDYKDLAFTFNKSILVNELEQITMAQQSLGVISQQTILENHPWVKDVQAEQERLEEEQNEYARNLSPVGGVNNEPTRD